MSKALAIARKEFCSCFSSAMAYIVLVLAGGIFSIFFFMIIDQDREAVLKSVFQAMEFMLLFIVPLLTMRTFAEERSCGTMELLRTAPLPTVSIVLGKYAGILAFYTILIAVTFVYYGIIEYFGTPDRGAVACGYAGIWLEGAFFVSVGIMASSWTANQLVAAMMAYAILFLLYFSSAFVPYFSGPAAEFFRQIATTGHLENFSVGLLTAGDLVYYPSGILACLVLTLLSLEERLWHQG